MKTCPAAKAPRNGAEYRANLKLSENVFNVLTDFSKQYMPAGCNSADAACAVLLTALIDYDHLMARCRQIEVYCAAEGIDQNDYRETVLRAKFKRGRVPRPKSSR